MNKICTLVVIGVLSVFLSGCATNFSNPISKPNCFYNKIPTIHIVQQGSIPATSVYRNNFYVIASTNASSRAFFTPEIVAEIISGGYQVITDVSQASAEKYYETLKNNYRWRNDIFIYGYENLSEEEIKFILEMGTKPQFDAQRSPALMK